MMESRLTIQDQPETVHTADQEYYRGMVGSLLYLASWTWPYIAFAVSELSRFVSNPGKPHLEEAKRVFRVPLSQEDHESWSCVSVISLPTWSS
jgi:hypothetical protein